MNGIHLHCRYLFAALVLTAIGAGANANTGPAKYALIIGNTNYAKERLSLRNPGNDAELMADCFEKVGFDVQMGLNLTHEQMDEAIDSFCDRLTHGSVAIVYYAGHGLQLNNEHFLVPVDARIDKPSKVPFQTYPQKQLIGLLEDTPTKIRLVILDCCRNNPWDRGWRNLQRASRSMSSYSRTLEQNAGVNTDGTAVFYATADGKKTPDGLGLNSPFTSALASVLAVRPEGGLRLLDAIRTTSRRVAGQVEHQPWLHYPPAMPECWLWPKQDVKYETLELRDGENRRNGRLELRKEPKPPTPPPTDDAGMARYLLEQADEDTTSGAHGRAIDAYTTLLTIDTLAKADRESALRGRGLAYKSRGDEGDLERAVRDFNAVGDPLTLVVKATRVEVKVRNDSRGEARRGQPAAVVNVSQKSGLTWYYVSSVGNDPKVRGWVPSSAFDEPAPEPVEPPKPVSKPKAVEPAPAVNTPAPTPRPYTPTPSPNPTRSPYTPQPQQRSYSPSPSPSPQYQPQPSQTWSNGSSNQYRTRQPQSNQSWNNGGLGWQNRNSTWSGQQPRQQNNTWSNQQPRSTWQGESGLRNFSQRYKQKHGRAPSIWETPQWERPQDIQRLRRQGLVR